MERPWTFRGHVGTSVDFLRIRTNAIDRTTWMQEQDYGSCEQEKKRTCHFKKGGVSKLTALSISNTGLLFRGCLLETIVQ